MFPVRFSKIINWPLREVFKLAPNISDVFNTARTSAKSFSDPLLFSRMFCYQYFGGHTSIVLANSSLMAKVPVISVGITSPFKSLNRNQLAGVMINQIANMTVYFDAFHISKLTYPYTDNCIDYTVLGYRDRHHYAIVNESKHELLNENEMVWKHSYRDMFPADTRIDYKGITSSKAKNVVNLTGYQHDCRYSFYVITIRQKLDKFTGIIIRIGARTTSSLSAISSPRIDGIDYISFVLGALGTWFRFAFINFDPFHDLLSHTSVTTSTSSETREAVDSVSRAHISSLEMKVHSMMRERVYMWRKINLLRGSKMGEPFPR